MSLDVMVAGKVGRSYDVVLKAAFKAANTEQRISQSLLEQVALEETKSVIGKTQTIGFNKIAAN